MWQKCVFMPIQGDRVLPLRKGMFDPLTQLGVFKSGFRKAEAIGIPSPSKILYGGKGGSVPFLILDLEEHMTLALGSSHLKDPKLVQLLGVACEDKLWRFMGSTDLSLTMTLALIGSGAGILGAVQLILQILSTKH